MEVVYAMMDITRQIVIQMYAERAIILVYLVKVRQQTIVQRAIQKINLTVYMIV